MSKEDERLKKVFQEAREMRKLNSRQTTLVIELTKKAVLSVLSYYGCDPEAQRIKLGDESHHGIVAKSVSKVLENSLIAKGLT